MDSGMDPINSLEFKHLFIYLIKLKYISMNNIND